MNIVEAINSCFVYVCQTLRKGCMVKMDVYANDNLRFRKAFIRERLVALKAERETLLVERDALDREIEILRAAKGQTSPNGNEADKAMSRRLLPRLRGYSAS